MVFSRSNRARSLAVLALACAVLHTGVAVQADDSSDVADYDSGSGSDASGSSGDGSGEGEYVTQEPLITGPGPADIPSLGASPSFGTACPFPVSQGDFAAGIQLVGDASCIKGGLGCFQNVCRFCQFRSTPQSNQFLTCKALGYDFSSPSTPTPAPTAAPTPVPPANPDTGCPYPASSGDVAAGVQLVGDATCAKGGLGCFQNVCRFCKLRETPQSKNWVPCSDLGYPRTQPPDFNTVSIGDYGCPYDVSSGDFDVGVQLVGDTSCKKGGLGCFKDVCRYCQFRETPQSKHLQTCQSLGYTIAQDPTISVQDIFDPTGETNCPFAVSQGDFAVGVQLLGDVSCSKGGLGCYQNICRFCKFKETAQSKHLSKCSDVADAQPTSPPTTSPPTSPPTTSPPTTSPPTPPTAIPQEIHEPDPVTKCPFPVSSGDLAAGIQLVGDATCSKGGLGCYQNVCRYCKFQESPQSTNWLTCTSLGFPQWGTPAPVTTSPPTAIPQDIIEPNPITKCSFNVSSGDFAAGIQLVGDASCSNGGLGCYLNQCRFCKFQETPQSTNWFTCVSLGFPQWGTPATVAAPVPTSSPPLVVDPATQCPYSVSSGDLAVGVQLVGDATCSKGGIGCYKDVCRYCKFQDTPQSTNWVTCTSLGFPQFDPVITPLDVTDTNCQYPVSGGDFAAGIQLVGDANCSSGGIGCYKNVCRYCQFRSTPQSANFVTCSSLGYSFSTATVAPSTTAPVNTVCTMTSPFTDPADGVGMTTDFTCLTSPTAAGCQGAGICRLCAITLTVSSHRYPPCPSTTVAPPAPPATNCPFAVSAGDLAAGVQLVGDATCSNGGIGCFQKVCRYCQVSYSVQSSQFVTCTSLGYNFGPAPAPAPSPAPAPTPLPSSCPFPLSAGDAAAGVFLVADPLCATGGIGCFQNVCRYCKTRDTPQSTTYLPCSNFGINPIIIDTFPHPVYDTPAPDYTPQCDQIPSEGDQAGKINIVTDAACLVDGGVGCIDKSVCRFCKIEETADNAHMEWCDNIVAPYDTTFPPLGGSPPDDSTTQPVAPLASNPPDSSTTQPVAPPVAALRPLRLAAKASARKHVKIATVKSAAGEGHLDELLKDSTFKWTLIGAACVGVVAVVALAAVGTKRVITRRRSNMAAQAATTATTAEVKVVEEGVIEGQV